MKLMDHYKGHDQGQQEHCQPLQFYCSLPPLIIQVKEGKLFIGQSYTRDLYFKPLVATVQIIFRRTAHVLTGGQFYNQLWRAHKRIA